MINFQVLNINLEGDTISKQDFLVQEALLVEKKLHILKILKKYGRAEIVGSVSHHLIINKDLDVHLLTKRNLMDTSLEIKNKLRTYNLKLKIDIENLINIKHAVYIGITNYHEWQIDIWVTNDINQTGFELSEKLNQEITLKKRSNILNLKKYYYNKNLLEGEMSTLIYTAVLDFNIKDPSEFENYLKNLNKKTLLEAIHGNK